MSAVCPLCVEGTETFGLMAEDP